ncbi:MAG: hypothetical protein ACPGLV_03930 [Bacteroidia bacterium]
MIFIIICAVYGCDVYPGYDCHSYDEKVALPDLPYLTDTVMIYAYYDTNGVELLIKFDSIITEKLLFSEDYYCHAEYEAIVFYAYGKSFILKVLQIAKDQQSGGKLNIQLIKDKAIVFEIDEKAPYSEYEKIDYYWDKLVIYSSERGVNLIQTNLFTFNRIR